MAQKQYRKTKGDLAELIGQVINTVSIYGEKIENGKVINILDNTIIVDDGRECHVVHKETLRQNFKRGDWTYRYKPNRERFDLRGCQAHGHRKKERKGKHFGW